jgi:DNA processing protein
MTTIDACDPCLRRTHLLGELAQRIEQAGRGRATFGGLLALGDDDLIAAMRADGDRNLHRARERFDPDAERTRCAADRLTVLCRHSPGYPARLLDLPDPPAMLHVAGDPATLDVLHASDRDVPAIAVVGARRATPYALDVAKTLGSDLAAAGVTVVSGMALGVDSAAHEGALAGGGPTIAVLGGGADRIYPSSKHRLYWRIRAHGCAVAELPRGSKAMRWTFPARNRLIAALVAAVVVVEARERSGSLITADLAADLGRPVGAVPGPVTASRSEGTNALLHDGAAVIRGARDALDLMAALPAPARRRERAVRDVLRVAEPPRPSPPPVRAEPPLEPALREMLAAVDDGADSPDRLAQVLDGDVAAATIALTRLELAGVLRRERDGSYSRRAR